ncbi:hypothetical protein OAP52_04995 [Hellea sp.]|nr:hypothetical protein [Hellea sp.]MDA8889171.1 hypothetical protein [Hellea sp.]MDB4845249.1 hypothetical protein [Hellea sp.]MDC0651400.1 hypothetical protein [Hellea sp.]MDC1088767.1 hypothetical protein [Hellea sp.]
MKVGDTLPEISIPITLHRLVMEAGANRDLSMIHHDSKVAQATGAPDVYANTFFLMGMFERQLREFIGVTGRIKKIGPMQMKTFNCVGDVLVFKATIKDVVGNMVSIEQIVESERGVTTVCRSKVEVG